MGHEIIVQQGPAGSAVAVRKWVDILKYRVEVRSCPDHVRSMVFADFLQQIGHVLRHTVCRGSHFVSPGNVIMLFVFAGPFPVFQESAFIVGSAGKDAVDLQNQFLG